MTTPTTTSQTTAGMNSSINHNRVISVLDHGFVRLIDSMGNDLSIVRAARVSYDADWRTGEDEGKDAKLIDYLIRNKHTSPIESVEIQLEVKLPIFLARQWHRHRTWAYNEVSARYSELPEEFYVPKPEHIGQQSANNKQVRDIDMQISWNAREMSELIRMQCETAFIAYKKLLHEGVPRELARTVLPVATYTHMFAKVDLHNLFHFLALRLHSHAQYEIRVYAEAILELITPIVPVTVEAWKRHNNIK